MPSRTTLILAALEVEARAAAAALSIPFVRGRALRSSHPDFVVEIDTVGMGGSRLEEVAARLKRSSDGVDLAKVLLVGLAGALDPTLRVGDLVIDRPPGIGDADAPATFPARPSWRAGRIHTADQIVTAPAQKKALFEQTGALAVDMEQSLVRAALAPLGLPVVGLRAISDAAETALPAALPRLVDSLGRPRPVALAMHLLRRPALAVELARLGRDSRRAMRSLRFGIQQLVQRRAGDAEGLA